MEFIGNHPVLDFHNTLAWPTPDGVNERIRDFDDLVLWSRTSGLVTRPEAARLLRDIARHPAQRTRVISEARRLRRLLHDVFGAIAERKRIPAAQLDKLNREVKRASGSLELGVTATGLNWTNDPATGAALILHRLVWETAQLLTSADSQMVRSCANRECGWLFLDTTKNHSRRWCSMSDCGSRAKARRYYRRNKHAARERQAVPIDAD